MVLAVPVDDEVSSSVGHEQSVMMFKFNDDASDQYFATHVNQFEYENHQPTLIDEVIE